jgi:hypothetical protein
MCAAATSGLLLMTWCHCWDLVVMRLMGWTWDWPAPCLVLHNTVPSDPHWILARVHKQYIFLEKGIIFSFFFCHWSIGWVCATKNMKSLNIQLAVANKFVQYSKVHFSKSSYITDSFKITKYKTSTKFISKNIIYLSALYLELLIFYLLLFLVS